MTAQSEPIMLHVEHVDAEPQPGTRIVRGRGREMGGQLRVNFIGDAETMNAIREAWQEPGQAAVVLVLPSMIVGGLN